MGNDLASESARLKRRFAAVFIGIALSAIAGGSWYHGLYKARLRADAEKLLVSTSRMKLEQISYWRQARLTDIAALIDGPMLKRYVSRFAADSTDRDAAAVLRSRLQTYIKHNKYTYGALIDDSGNTLLSAGEKDPHLYPGVKELLPKALASGRPEMGDIHLGPDGGPAHIAIIARVAGAAPGGRGIMLLLRIPPEVHLYPLLQAWSAKGATGEMLLVSRSGEDVLFLSELRHRKDAAMKLRVPVSEALRPSVMAVQGREGVVEGPDYRGARVLAAISQVSDTGWGLVTKMDMDEVMEGAGLIGFLLALSVLSLLGLAGAAAFLLFSRQAAQYARDMRQAEQRYSRLYQSMRDSFVRVSMDGHIAECNEAYCRLTGYTEEELKKLTYRQLTPERWHAMEESIVRGQIMPRGYSEVYEKEYLRKDGTTVPVEFVTSLETDAAGKPSGMWAIVRDITARKAAETVLRQSEALLENTQSLAGIGGWEWDLDKKSMHWTAEMFRLHDIDPGEIGPVAEDYISASQRCYRPEDLSSVMEAFNRCVENGEPYDLEYPFTTLKGRKLWVRTTAKAEREGGRIVRVLGILADITEYKKVEADAAESEARFRQLFESMEEGFAVHDMICDPEGRPSDYRFLTVNPAFERLTGLKGADIVGRTVREVIPSIEAEWIENYGKVALTGTPMHFENFSGGLGRWYDVSAFSPRRGQFAVSFLDVTARRRAEDALRESKAKLEAALASTTDAVLISDAEGNFIEFNDAFAAFHKFRDKAECGKKLSDYPDILDVFLPDGTLAPPDMWAVPRALRGETASNAEYSLRRRDTGETWVGSYSFSPIRGSNGAVAGSVVLARDITENKRIEHINAARARLIQYSVTHSLDELLEETLNEAEKISGSLIGFYHFVDDDQQALTLQNWSTRTKAQFCMAKGKGEHYPVAQAGVWVDCVHQRKPVIHNDYASLAHRKGMPEGHAEVLREMVIPVFRGEKITAILGVGNKARDYVEKDVEAVSLLADLAWEIAERKRAELAVDSLNRVLLEKNREMENFLYITTHDLRGPLVNIQGFSQNLQHYFGEVKELLAAGEQAPGGKPRAGELTGKYIPESLGFIIESSARMDAMLTALLKVSRLGRQELKPERVHAGLVVSSLADTMSFQLREAGAVLKIGQLPPCRADALSVSQIFSNLLDNALKYREPERPLIIDISGEEAGDKAVYRVSDNGRGITAGELGKIWNIFYSRERGRENAGEGIGLHMVKRMAEINGGSIRAESVPGQGSVFILELQAWRG